MKYLSRIFWVAVGCTFLFPLYWMITMSLKSKSEAYSNPFGIPQSWRWDSFGEALSKYHYFTYLENSLIYTVGTIVITLTTGSMLAYCLSRMQWKFNTSMLFYVSMGLIVPIEVVVIPLFQLIKFLHLKNSYLGLILPYSGFAIASCVLMLYAFLRSLPKELEEAACIDGTNVYQAFFKIIFPIIMPALVTQCVLIFIRIWNEFPLAFIVASRDQFRPLTVGLLSFFVNVGVSDWGLIGATMFLSSLPMIIVYMVGNEKIENALTAGAILK
ncbi:carbohydrate ABC transporter permease [Cohnella lupini]|uniref:Carbohydrate ABC transporter membrane protein 2 (CUT1 family) n=1 Tax=Cohnella lupini TaxID=1294267 RepID=A0A3D9IJC8_9BACL|nr:carbohydrate ABC transporter permease [Cohnella lupini]RED61870.1 carbohydrate ABC transporter membrane protein 2 (CUT1 family) [Cohnella lupini]